MRLYTKNRAMRGFLFFFKLHSSLPGYDISVEGKTVPDRDEKKPEEVFDMLNRKKLIALSMTACLAVSAIPAFAEDTAVDMPTQSAEDTLIVAGRGGQPGPGKEEGGG